MLNLTSPEDGHLQSSILLHARNYNQRELPGAMNAPFLPRMLSDFCSQTTLARIPILGYNNTIQSLAFRANSVSSFKHFQISNLR